VRRAQPGMLDSLLNTTQGLWTIGGVATGIVVLICAVVVARSKVRIAPRSVLRTEADARASQANRDRLAGRR
jgi:hypothetical protein